jgi:hypothetical protein
MGSACDQGCEPLDPPQMDAPITRGIGIDFTRLVDQPAERAIPIPE